MQMKLRNVALVVGSSLAGVLAGALVLGPNLSMAFDGDRESVSSHTSSDDGRFRDPRPEEVVASPPYPVNTNGQTYGSGMNIDADNPGPDLIAAYGTNGAFGYVLATDRPQPATSLVKDFTRQKTTTAIPLYEVNGETVVGEFAIVPGESSSR